MKRRIVEFMIREHRRRSLNYDDAVASLRLLPSPFEAGGRIRIHKRNTRKKLPKLSILLLDWSCRERFDPLEWLDQQDVPRDEYELIWVELFDRVAPQAMERADAVLTCHQQGRYHKHEGYNAGLLVALGELFCVCDSDAVFPTDFVRSIFRHFYADPELTGEFKAPSGSVLFHFEARSSVEYPGLREADDLKDKNWLWWGLHPNVGACMTVRTVDAIRYGGFDEHAAYAGYLCGPYELGWRLLNAGLPEVWHDQATMLWHFAHPDPVGDNGIVPSLRQIGEIVYPHVDLHALHAVEALTSGRMLPLQENPALFSRRMASRSFGTGFVTHYAFSGSPQGFSKKSVRKMRRHNEWEALRIHFARLAVRMMEVVATVLRPRLVPFVRERRARRPASGVYRVANWVIYAQAGQHFGLPAYVNPEAPEAKAQRVPGNDFWSVRSSILQMPPAWCFPAEPIETDSRDPDWTIFAFLNLVVAMPSGRAFDLGRQLLDPAPAYWGKTVASVQTPLHARAKPSPIAARRELLLEALGALLSWFPGAPEATPLLIAILFDCNLVYFKGTLFQLPHALGRIDFFGPQGTHIPGIRRITSRTELAEFIDGQLKAAGANLAAGSAH
jgi:hypothetical protein